MKKYLIAAALAAILPTYAVAHTPEYGVVVDVNVSYETVQVGVNCTTYRDYDHRQRNHHRRECAPVVRYVPTYFYVLDYYGEYHRGYSKLPVGRGDVIRLNLEYRGRSHRGRSR